MHQFLYTLGAGKMNLALLRSVFVIVWSAAILLPDKSEAWRFHSRRVIPDAEEWDRESHLRLSAACADTKCTWPAHTGSSLFRLFRGRRSPIVPSFGLDLMMPWLTATMNNEPNASANRRQSAQLTGRPASAPTPSMFAIRRGPNSKPVSRLKGTRLAMLPPRVAVQIYGLDGNVYATTVPLRPQTSLFEILNQASARFRDQNPRGASNPFHVLAESRKTDESCVEITSVGLWPKSSHGTWDIELTDSKGKVLLSDSCLISADRGPVTVHPGSKVTLLYKSALTATA